MIFLFLKSLISETKYILSWIKNYQIHLFVTNLMKKNIEKICSFLNRLFIEINRTMELIRFINSSFFLMNWFRIFFLEIFFYRIFLENQNEKNPTKSSKLAFETQSQFLKTIISRKKKWKVSKKKEKIDEHKETHSLVNDTRATTILMIGCSLLL